MNSLESAQKNKAKKILAKWQATQKQVESILPSCSDESILVERYSLLIKIDQDICILFNNPENINGFMTMTNNNPYFLGRRPLDIIAGGDIETIKAVSKKIKALGLM
jgi:hypothetical protein